MPKWQIVYKGRVVGYADDYREALESAEAIGGTVESTYITKPRPPSKRARARRIPTSAEWPHIYGDARRIRDAVFAADLGHEAKEKAYEFERFARKHYAKWEKIKRSIKMVEYPKLPDDVFKELVEYVDYFDRLFSLKDVKAKMAEDEVTWKSARLSLEELKRMLGYSS